MSKPVLSLPVIVSTGVAILAATIAYAVVSRLPSDQSNLGLGVSPFQTDLVQDKNILGKSTNIISREETDR